MRPTMTQMVATMHGGLALTLLARLVVARGILLSLQGFVKKDFRTIRPMLFKHFK